MSEMFVKESAHKLIDKLPSTATWEDLIHQIYVRKIIENGLADSKAGRTKCVNDIREKYGYSCCNTRSPKHKKIKIGYLLR